MDEGVSPTMGVLVFAILLVLDFVIFGFMAAMENLNQASIEKMAKEGENRAAQLLKYTDKTERYRHVCQLIILVVHMILGFYQIPLWEAYFLPEPTKMAVSFAVDVLIFAVLILLVLIIGIYTPEKVASRKPDSFALRLVGFVHVVELVFYPAIFLTDAVANLLSRIFGVDPLSDTDDVTEEEIISMVKEGHEQGVLLASEAEMIHNIFEFGDKEAKDIMTHRKNLVALDASFTFAETLPILTENHYSRFPVYRGTIDDIIGVLHIKEALCLCQKQELLQKPIGEIEGLISEVDFIPETRNINVLFTRMQNEKCHMTIVVDEYGQTSGIVTMEDILEEIVGNIEDEHDEEMPMIQKLSDGSYRMDGMAEFEEVVETLGIDAAEEDDFETLNGFLISLIDKIPNDDEVFSTTAYGYLFEILSVQNKMIHTVKVTKLPEEEQNADETCQNEEKMVK